MTNDEAMAEMLHRNRLYAMGSAVLPVAECLPPCFHRMHTRLLLHWEKPSFANWQSWLVAADNQAETIRLRKCTMQCDTLPPMPSAGAKIPFEEAPQPLFEVRDVLLPQGAWEGISAGLYALRLPVCFPPSNSYGFDGTFYGLETATSMCRTTLNWWCDEPPEWAPLHAWAARLRAFLDAAVANTAPALHGEGAPGAQRIQFPLEPRYPRSDDPR